MGLVDGRDPPPRVARHPGLVTEADHDRRRDRGVGVGHGEQQRPGLTPSQPGLCNSRSAGPTGTTAPSGTAPSTTITSSNPAASTASSAWSSTSAPVERRQQLVGLAGEAAAGPCGEQHPGDGQDRTPIASPLRRPSPRDVSRSGAGRGRARSRS